MREVGFGYMQVDGKIVMVGDIGGDTVTSGKSTPRAIMSLIATDGPPLPVNSTTAEDPSSSLCKLVWNLESMRNKN